MYTDAVDDASDKISVRWDVSWSTSSRLAKAAERGGRKSAYATTFWRLALRSPVAPTPAPDDDDVAGPGAGAAPPGTLAAGAPNVVV